MCKPGMGLIMLATSILPCLCLGAGVELTASPSPVREGGSLTMTCSWTKNSALKAKFIHENGTQIGFLQLMGGECNKYTRQFCRPKCSCTSNGKSVSWTISTVTRSLDKARVKCWIYDHSPTPTHSDTLDISVTYPPNGTLSMTSSGTRSIVTGTSVTLLCQVGGGNPLATLTWQCKGSALAGLDLTNATTAMSSLTVNVDETYHQQQCVCTARQQASPSVHIGTVNVVFDVRYPPNGILSMTPAGTESVMTGTSVTLLCQVGGGNPLATLTWHCKGSTLAGRDLTNATTAMSSLAVKVDKTYHQQQCVCTGRQQASPIVQLGTVNVVFDILYAPEKNTFTIDSNSPFIEGDDVYLDCMIDGGNPLAILSWTCIDQSKETSINMDTTTRAIMRLNITSITRDYDWRLCVCKATHVGLAQNLVRGTEIAVYYPPEKTTLTIDNRSPFYEGDDVYMDCMIGGSNPLTTLSWTCVDQSKETSTKKDSVTRAIRRLAITSISRQYNGRRCTCTATHVRLAKNLVTSTEITVYYAPEKTTFTIDSNSPFDEGDDIYIDCMIDGGNPLATLSWTCVDQSKETTINMDTATRAIRRLAITSISRVYNGRRCTCTATHVGLAQNLAKETAITVYYAPEKNTFTIDSNSPFIEGDDVYMDCTIDGGNPLATLSWKCVDQSKETSINMDTTTRAIRRLVITSIIRVYSERMCTCTATHVGLAHTLVIEKEITVYYPPTGIVTMSPSGTRTIETKTPVTLHCQVKGGFPRATLTWQCKGLTVVGEKSTIFETAVSEIALTVDRTYHQQQCICTARHPASPNGQFGTATIGFDILYGPDVDLAITNTTENATNVHLKCTANGIPDRYTYRWKHMFASTVIRDTFDHVTSSGSISTLTIPRATYQDMGTYVCEVNNGYRGRDGQIVQTRQGVLSVKGSPRAIRAQKRYITEKGISLDINITYISFPEPVNTSIIRIDAALPSQSELFINVSSMPLAVPFYSKDVSVDGYMVHLHFSKFETKHQGLYQLYIRNAFAYYFNFEVIISDKPDPPSGLVIGQITKSSAVISWVPGDDGGHIQMFIVLYRQYQGGLQTEVTLDNTMSSFTVADLDIATRYDVTVYASNIKGTSEIMTSTFKTAADTTESAVGGQSNHTDIGVVLISVASVMILLSLLIVAVFTLRKGRFLCRRNTTESVRQVEPQRDVPHTENDQRGQQVYYDISLEQVEIPAEDDVATDNEDVMPGKNRHHYDDISLEQVGIPVEDDVVTDNEGAMPGENRQQYEGLSLEQVGIPAAYDVVADNEGGMPDENRQQNEDLSLEKVGSTSVYDVVTGTGQDRGYVNTSLPLH